jgi:transcriptional regulator with XRE-family HTH domain
VGERDQVLGRQIAAARVLLGLKQEVLAEAAFISVPTLRRMEASKGPTGGYANNVVSVRRALEAAGIEFIDGGVKLREMRVGDRVRHLLPSGPDLFNPAEFGVVFEVRGCPTKVSLDGMIRVRFDEKETGWEHPDKYEFAPG